MNKRAFEELGEIYAAGGLAKLNVLDIAYSHHDVDATGVWMEGVLASEHQGGALKQLHVSRCAAMPIIDALDRGALVC